MKNFSLCHGAGLRICDGCERHVDRHPLSAVNPHQPFIGATTSDRCHNWKASSAPTPRNTISHRDEE